jgi:uncharacterized protein
MNETSATLRHAGEARAPVSADDRLPPPWGVWSTLCWALGAFVLGGVIVGGGVLWLTRNQPDNLPDVQHDPWFPLQFILINLVQIAVLAWAARSAGWPVARYLGLVRPRRRDLMHGVAALAVVILALEILTHVLGRESVTPFQSDSYRAARAADLLPLLWLAFVIAAPVGEEIVFRGFVFRGWAASRLGPQLTILLTSLIFSAAHTQYDWFGVVQTFCIGALFGWLRWRSGSTTLAILLHMGVNFVATAWAAIKAEGLV